MALGSGSGSWERFVELVVPGGGPLCLYNPATFPFLLPPLLLDALVVPRPPAPLLLLLLLLFQPPPYAAADALPAAAAVAAAAVAPAVAFDCSCPRRCTARSRPASSLLLIGQGVTGSLQLGGSCIKQDVKKQNKKRRKRGVNAVGGSR